MYERSLGDIIKKTDALFIYSLSLFTHYLLIPQLFISFIFSLFHDDKAFFYQKIMKKPNN